MQTGCQAGADGEGHSDGLGYLSQAEEWLEINRAQSGRRWEEFSSSHDFIYSFNKRLCSHSGCQALGSRYCGYRATKESAAWAPEWFISSGGDKTKKA